MTTGRINQVSISFETHLETRSFAVCFDGSLPSLSPSRGQGVPSTRTADLSLLLLSNRRLEGRPSTDKISTVRRKAINVQKGDLISPSRATVARIAKSTKKQKFVAASKILSRSTASRSFGRLSQAAFTLRWGPLLFC